MGTLLRPLIRLLVGFIAIPLFRLFLRRVVHLQRLDTELTKDLEQWVRGSILLLLATANVEYAVFGEYLENLRSEFVWFTLGMRLLFAVGVIESMPDQALFSIIHPGPSGLLLPKGRRFKAVREQFWPFCKGLFFRHLDRSSSVFALMSVIFGSPTHPAVGWACYGLAITQFLIIGLVSSRDKALDVLSEFDRQVKHRREMLSDQYREFGENDEPPSPPLYRGV
ncbi:MAG TPA: DNA topoisomerase I [Planctomycetaceae bacterium]|nr:DNA topoisomerase I [Planctomycetaceae bacterium]